VNSKALTLEEIIDKNNRAKSCLKSNVTTTNENDNKESLKSKYYRLLILNLNL
jgi:hypothetical protein